MECLIVQVHGSFIDLKVGVSLTHPLWGSGVALCFASSFLNMLGNIPSKE